jgi:hypothetical protein
MYARPHTHTHGRGRHLSRTQRDSIASASSAVSSSAASSAAAAGSAAAPPVWWASGLGDGLRTLERDEVARLRTEKKHRRSTRAAAAALGRRGTGAWDPQQQQQYLGGVALGRRSPGGGPRASPLPPPLSAASLQSVQAALLASAAPAVDSRLRVRTEGGDELLDTLVDSINASAAARHPALLSPAKQQQQTHLQQQQQRSRLAAVREGHAAVGGHRDLASSHVSVETAELAEAVSAAVATSAVATIAAAADDDADTDADADANAGGGRPGSVGSASASAADAAAAAALRWAGAHSLLAALAVLAVSALADDVSGPDPAPLHQQQPAPAGDGVFLLDFLCLGDELPPPARCALALLAPQSPLELLPPARAPPRANATAGRRAGVAGTAVAVTAAAATAAEAVDTPPFAAPLRLRPEKPAAQAPTAAATATATAGDAYDADGYGYAYMKDAEAEAEAAFGDIANGAPPLATSLGAVRAAVAAEAAAARRRARGCKRAAARALSGLTTTDRLRMPSPLTVALLLHRAAAPHVYLHAAAAAAATSAAATAAHTQTLPHTRRAAAAVSAAAARALTSVAGPGFTAAAAAATVAPELARERGLYSLLAALSSAAGVWVQVEKTAVSLLTAGTGTGDGPVGAGMTAGPGAASANARMGTGAAGIGERGRLLQSLEIPPGATDVTLFVSPNGFARRVPIRLKKVFIPRDSDGILAATAAAAAAAAAGAAGFSAAGRRSSLTGGDTGSKGHWEWRVHSFFGLFAQGAPSVALEKAGGDPLSLHRTATVLVSAPSATLSATVAALEARAAESAAKAAAEAAETAANAAMEAATHARIEAEEAEDLKETSD